MYRKNVLIVASDVGVRSVVASALRAGGYGVFEAKDGMEALERAGLDNPGMVFIDLGLQGSPDGWNTVKLLGESPRTEGIPLVVLSHSGREGGDLRKAALLGCCGLVQDTDPAAALAAARAVVGEPISDVPPETPTGVIRRRYCRRPVPAA